jgi:hypothetical protein
MSKTKKEVYKEVTGKIHKTDLDIWLQTHAYSVLFVYGSDSCLNKYFNCNDKILKVKLTIFEDE